jgi:serine O-acetyltransferase
MTSFPSNVSSQKVTVGESWQALWLMFCDLQQDILRYTYMNHCHWLVACLRFQGLAVTVQYRCSRWVHFYCHILGLRIVLKLVCAIWQRHVLAKTGVELSNRAEIGAGLFISHANGIVIHMDAKIGKNCNLGHQVTIGMGLRDRQGSPKVGDQVFFAPGAKVFGSIKIGNNVAIGANAVVFQDLPDNAVAVGIPARIASYRGSQDFVLYPGCQKHQSSSGSDMFCASE